MKKVFLKYTLLFLTIIFSSCSNFLNLEPFDRETSGNFYQTEEDAVKALVSIYDALKYQSSVGISWAPFMTVSDMMSDDAYAGGADANDGMEENEFNKHNISTTNPMVQTLWNNYYKGIYRANLYLEKIEGIEASDDFKIRTVAEAKFLRAYFYFQLVSLFENIPLLTQTLGGTSDYNQTQADPEDVYKQIAADLYEAAADLPESVNAAEAGRVTKWTAQALPARVYLFHNGIYGGDLQAGDITITAAVLVQILDNLIDVSGHDLLPDYADNFKIAGEFGKEAVFEISYGDSPAWWDWQYVEGGNGNLSSQMQGQRVTGSANWNRGRSFAPVSYKLSQKLAGDPRYSATIVTQDELDGTLEKGFQHTGYFSRKYTSDAEHWGADGQFELNRTTNFMVIRFADVLLMSAELGSPRTQEHLDRVRDRVGLTSVPATYDNIMAERRLELSLEGLRYFDVIRRGMS